jgi:hypothetical protein
MAEAVIPEPAMKDGIAYWGAIFGGWDQLVELPLAQGSALPLPPGWDGSEALR